LSMAVLVTMSSAIVGCHFVEAKSDVIGFYELKAGHDLIRLELAPDEHFTETIRWASGKTEKRTGTWQLTNGTLNLDELWIPQSFAPEYILHADAESGPNQPKYTEPGHWSISPVSYWGTITLEVFEDVSFKKVR